MQLTKLQLTEIKNFISKKGIKYLDVQMEIIDHTASAVEERLSADPSLSFEQALKQTHASFGVFGFSTMEDAIISGMGKKYARIFWKKFLSFFGRKYILILLSSGFLVYKLHLVNSDFASFSLLTIAGMIAVLILYGLRHYKNYKNLYIYRTSIIYFMFIGSFFQIFNFFLNNASDVIIYGVHRNFVIQSLALVVFSVYVITAIRTAKIGVEESKVLLNKYSLLNS